jgi:crotonobetainyl-CoA:carnitine CoA-transferase CaiB-like acyl-CoA transferase
VGEHTWEVLEEAGYTGDEIEELVEQAIVIAK